MEIQCDPDEGTLEHFRPTQPMDWQYVTSGYWEQGPYHSGHIEYRLAQNGPSQWMLERIERNAELDSVTEEDVEAGRLNDDQLQAMWGLSLAEAQDQEHRQIVAVADGVPSSVQREELIDRIFEVLCKSGGKMISEPDEVEEE